MVSRRVLVWLAEEVERQGDGPLEVVGLHDAWKWLVDSRIPRSSLFFSHILALHHLAVPKDRPNIRSVPVVFENGGRALEASLIPDRLGNLLAAVREKRVTPELFYQEYETIHPFTDGNGRTGSLWYNWMRGSLRDPKNPPDYWKEND